MTKPSLYLGGELAVARDGHIMIVEIRRPPHNFFDRALIEAIADAFEDADRDDSCRAIVLCAEGTAFCAGASFGDPDAFDADGNAPGAPDAGELRGLYDAATRLFACGVPCIAAVQGPAIGGGFGLAMMADFRVTCDEARFSANFTRLGIHPGFGLSVTLPRIVGQQRAALVFATARRMTGGEAVELGLADVLVPHAEVRRAAMTLAREIAANAPLAVRSTRATLRRGLTEAVQAATEIELAEQVWLRRTADFREGIRASHQRRKPDFSAT
ncbi:MAG: enoyl-CoA hydratase/isomerase family protein [Hyphomicrobiaceae bacterium]